MKKKWIFEMLGAVVAILLFLYVITVFQSCKIPKPVAETISNTDVKNVLVVAGEREN